MEGRIGKHEDTPTAKHTETYVCDASAITEPRKSKPSEQRIAGGEEFEQSLAEAPKHLSFQGPAGLTGAEVFALLCRAEKLGALFCAPGNYKITHAIAAAGIPSYGGRTEGGMCSAADGFYRASGEVAACSGTDGPGFAHMLMGISAAYVARTPLLILASNSSLAADDRGLPQDMRHQPITEYLRKYGKRITAPNRVYEYGAHAFRHLKSGVPGPVHLDFAHDVSTALFTDETKLTEFFESARYRTESVAAPRTRDLEEALKIIEEAECPLIIAGHGVFHRRASRFLREAAEKNELAVAVSGPNRGHFPDDHRLSINLSPGALRSVDLVIFIGQYAMPPRAFYPFRDNVKSIRVHPQPEDLGRNWPLDLGIVSDEYTFLELLVDGLPRVERPQWVAEINRARRQYEEELDAHYKLGLTYSSNGAVHPAVVGRAIYDFFFAGRIDPLQTVSGWGGYTSQRFVPPRLRANRPGQSIIPMYQSGAIGVSVPMMVGATVAVKNGVGEQNRYRGAPVLAYCSDGDMGYGMLELETAVKYRLPIIVVVFNNNSWGSWFNAEGSQKSLHLHLFAEGIRYDKMAEAFGAHGEHVCSPEQLQGALQRSYNIAARESIPSVINVQSIKEFTSESLYPPGLGTNPEPGIGSHFY